MEGRGEEGGRMPRWHCPSSPGFPTRPDTRPPVNPSLRSLACVDISARGLAQSHSGERGGGKKRRNVPSRGSRPRRSSKCWHSGSRAAKSGSWYARAGGGPRPCCRRTWGPSDPWLIDASCWGWARTCDAQRLICAECEREEHCGWAGSAQLPSLPCTSSAPPARLCTSSPLLLNPGPRTAPPRAPFPTSGHGGKANTRAGARRHGQQPTGCRPAAGRRLG